MRASFILVSLASFLAISATPLPRREGSQWQPSVSSVSLIAFSPPEIQRQKTDSPPSKGQPPLQMQGYGTDQGAML